MKQFVSLLLILFLFVCKSAFAQTVTISGILTDAKTGETLIGASVVCKEESKGTITNAFGFYTIDVNPGSQLSFSYIGYTEYQLTVSANTPLPLNIQLNEIQKELNEVVIVATQPINENQNVGVTKLDLKQINSVPVLGGEKDLVKVLQLMPGVKKEHDGSSGMLVRGGSGDQNLVLIDDAPVYNASHLVGFFSVFNADAVKDVTLQKGGFTANYGGRLSSALDVRMKDGNMKKMKTTLGAGFLSAHAAIEGPILKDKLSYIITGRRSYIDHTYRLANSSLPFYFYDLNAKINYRISEQDQLLVSAYRGKDVLKFGSTEKASVYDVDFANRMRNTTATLRWNHVYNNPKFYQRTSLIYTRYDYRLISKIDANQMQLSSSITDLIGKMELDYYANPNNQLKFGGEFTQHAFRPNKTQVMGDYNETIKTNEGQLLQNSEMAIFVSNSQRINHRLSAQYGLRYSGATANHTMYTKLEPRLNLSYVLTESQTIKLAYSHMTQYVNLVSGSSIMPSDVWYPVTDRIKPQLSKQITAGYTKQLLFDITFNVEGYYKWQNNVVEFREGTIAFSNENIEEDIVQGTAQSYGIEFLLHKKSGKWNGWLGYTLAYSKRHFDELNGGETFFARYDRRHDFSLVQNYELTPRLLISGVYTFATGSRFTPIIGQYFVPSGALNSIVTLPIYSKRNAVVLAPSHRLDLNIVLKSKTDKRYAAEWHFGVYNVYNQTQPYRMRIVKNSDNTLKYEQVGLFGFLPSIAYQITF